MRKRGHQETHTRHLPAGHAVAGTCCPRHWPQPLALCTQPLAPAKLQGSVLFGLRQSAALAPHASDEFWYGRALDRRQASHSKDTNPLVPSDTG